MKISQRAKGTPFSGIREMFNLAKNYSDVVNLGIGEPAFDTPKNIIEAGASALRNGYTKYVPNAGILELREEIANKLLRENNIKGTAENIIVTTGAGEAMMLALQAIVDIGDEVLVPDPCFPNYFGQIHVAGAKAIPVKTYEEDKFHITAKEIEKSITPKTKVIVINSPCNPTGAVLNREEIEEIAKIAMKNNLIVVSDEPYETIIFDGREHISIASLKGMEEHVITINSFSKSYAMTGWRVGYAHAPKNVIDKMVILQESVASCVNASAQMACIEALKGPQDVVSEMTREYDKRRNLLIDGLNEIDGISCIKSEGAFYAFANIKQLGMTSKEVSKMLLEKVQVVTTPGSAFGNAGEGYLRFSFASSEENISRGLELMKKALKDVL